MTESEWTVRGLRRCAPCPRRGAGAGAGGDGRLRLFNVNQRIQLNYGREYGLKIQSTYGQGTEIWVRIPCRAEKIKRKRNISKKNYTF